MIFIYLLLTSDIWMEQLTPIEWKEARDCSDCSDHGPLEHGVGHSGAPIPLKYVHSFHANYWAGGFLFDLIWQRRNGPQPRSVDQLGSWLAVRLWPFHPPTSHLPLASSQAPLISAQQRSIPTERQRCNKRVSLPDGPQEEKMASWRRGEIRRTISRLSAPIEPIASFRSTRMGQFAIHRLAWKLFA